MNPPPTSIPITSLWVSPAHQPQACCILHRTLHWRFDSYMIVYMFQCHSPTSSQPLPLPLSPKVRYTHLSFLLSCIRGHHCHQNKERKTKPQRQSSSWECWTDSYFDTHSFKQSIDRYLNVLIFLWWNQQVPQFQLSECALLASFSNPVNQHEQKYGMS